jgi:hypothetical protein
MVEEFPVGKQSLKFEIGIAMWQVWPVTAVVEKRREAGHHACRQLGTLRDIKRMKLPVDGVHDVHKIQEALALAGAFLSVRDTGEQRPYEHSISCLILGTCG